MHITSSLTVSHGAQEIFKLLPHTFVEAEKLPEIYAVYANAPFLDICYKFLVHQ
jgi:hypothetical protein